MVLFIILLVVNNRSAKKVVLKYYINKIPILLCVLRILFYLCNWFVSLGEDCTTIFEGKISVCCLLTFRSLAAEEYKISNQANVRDIRGRACLFL